MGEAPSPDHQGGVGATCRSPEPHGPARPRAAGPPSPSALRSAWWVAVGASRRGKTGTLASAPAALRDAARARLLRNGGGWTARIATEVAVGLAADRGRLGSHQAPLGPPYQAPPRDHAGAARPPRSANSSSPRAGPSGPDGRLPIRRRGALSLTGGHSDESDRLASARCDGVVAPRVCNGVRRGRRRWRTRGTAARPQWQKLLPDRDPPGALIRRGARRPGAGRGDPADLGCGTAHRRRQPCVREARDHHWPQSSHRACGGGDRL